MLCFAALPLGLACSLFNCLVDFSVPRQRGRTRMPKWRIGNKWGRNKKIMCCTSNVFCMDAWQGQFGTRIFTAGCFIMGVDTIGAVRHIQPHIIHQRFAWLRCQQGWLSWMSLKNYRVDVSFFDACRFCKFVAAQWFAYVHKTRVHFWYSFCLFSFLAPLLIFAMS